MIFKILLISIVKGRSQEHGLWYQTAWVQRQVITFTSCYLGKKLLNCSSFCILFLGINELIYVKNLEQCQTYSNYLINLIISSTICFSCLLLYNKVP